MASQRTIRITEELKRVLSYIIRNDVKDDRMSQMVSVSHVEMTPDLKYAKVYISVYDTEKKRKGTIDALNHGASYIRTKLSRKMTARTVPALTFFLDTSIEYSFEIEKKLKEVLPGENE